MRRAALLSCCTARFFIPLLPLALSCQKPAQAGPPRADSAPGPARTPDGEAAPIVADKLPPLASGPGLGVCEPTTKNADADTADIGSGCARWLQFALGDYPRLGQTPRLSAQERTRREMNLANLRLTPVQAERFARITGYTHMAVGAITGTPTHCALTYQIYAMPGRLAVSGPLQVSGSQAQVIAALPRLLGQMLAALKLPPLPLPPTPTLTPAEMSQLGRYAWWPDGAVSDEAQRQMDALAAQQPLAGLLSRLHGRMADTRMLETAARRLLAQAPNNLEVRAELVTAWYALSPDLQQEFSRSMPAAPNNYFVAAWKYAAGKTAQQFVTDAERLARCAPRDPAAWLTLARQYGRSGEQLRRGRPVTMLADADWRTLIPLYAHWYAAARRAADLDAEYGLAWTETSIAATFAGDSGEADAAFWKAMRLDSKNPVLYEWGLQMYQPKWFGDADKLHKVVQRAEAAKTLAPDAAYSVSAALQRGGWRAEAKTVYARAMEGYRDAVRRAPDNAAAHAKLGLRLMELQQYAEALTESQAAVRLAPEFPEGHFDLGMIYQATGRMDQALAELRETVRVSPQAYNALARLGDLLIRQGKWEEAEPAYRQALRVMPDFYDARLGLGIVLAKKQENDAALAQFEYAGRLQPEYSEPYFRRSGVYAALKQYDRALAEVKRGQAFSPQASRAHYYLGLAYTGQKQYEAAAEEFRAALGPEPKTAAIHLELGRVLLKLDRKAEAETELKTVLSLEPGGAYAREAQQMLDQQK